MYAIVFPDGTQMQIGLTDIAHLMRAQSDITVVEATTNGAQTDFLLNVPVNDRTELWHMITNRYSDGEARAFERMGRQQLQEQTA